MKRLLGLLAAAFVIAAILFCIDYYRHRYVRENTDLVRLLPPGDLNLIYADLGVLRQAQLLGLMANIKVAPDREYDAFLAQTGFDYTRDLEAVAVAMDPARTFLVGRGRFPWDKLKAFVLGHHGSCQAEACRVPASTPGRWVNFISIQADVLAVAITPDQSAADEMRPPGRRVQEEIPNAPVWAKLSRAMLTNPATLPLPIQIFAISVQSAQSVTLFAQTESLHLKAHFANGSTADTARRQLEIQTRQLGAALGENKPDPATLGALLTAGSFQVTGNDVEGTWPMRPELLKALQ